MPDDIIIELRLTRTEASCLEFKLNSLEQSRTKGIIRGFTKARIDRTRRSPIEWVLRPSSNPVCFRMCLLEDRNWVAKIYQERAIAFDVDQNVTYFFLKDYQEVCRYMRTIGYGSKGKAETVEQQVARELKIGRFCSLRTTVRGRQSTQDIALFIYQDVSADLLGSGLVAVSFDAGGELAKEFVDAWFQKADAAMKEGLSNKEDS